MGEHRAVRFKQSDVTRALIGARKAGVSVKVTIDPHGNIAIVPCAPEATTANDDTWADFK